MPHDCPLCGQPVADMPVTILAERGMVVGNGRFAILTTKEAAVLTRLAELFPRLVSKEALMDWLYQLSPDDPPNEKIIDVWICKIRKKVAPLGIRIDTAWGKGYGLAVAAKPVIVREAA